MTDLSKSTIMKSTGLTRRSLLASTAAYLASTATAAKARTISGAMPWAPGAADPPRAWRPGPWMFFTADEAATIEAIVDRLIPSDEHGPGGKQAGCAVFIDRQLAGPYGQGAGLYMKPPFLPGLPTQTAQSPEAPAAVYRAALSAFADQVSAKFGGKHFSALSAEDQDALLSELQKGSVDLKTIKGADFFNLLLQNTQEGYFADPIYGGNRDMAGWKLVGFPGTRYDYRDWVERHNEPYPLPPVAITGRAEWTVRD
jgi:gluconate 2-dehydrogenase gamma chain